MTSSNVTLFFKSIEQLKQVLSYNTFLFVTSSIFKYTELMSGLIYKLLIFTPTEMSISTNYHIPISIKHVAD